MGPSGEETPPPPGFPFRKSSKSKGKKPMIRSKGEPPPPPPRPRPPPGSVSRTYRDETCSSSASFYSSRPPGESSSTPYGGDTSAIVCGGNTFSPCCQGGSSNSPPPFADGEFPVGLRVLLVDDDQICLTIVSQLLTECRYEGIYKDLDFLFASLVFSCLTDFLIPVLISHFGFLVLDFFFLACFPSFSHYSLCFLLLFGLYSYCRSGVVSNVFYLHLQVISLY